MDSKGVFNIELFISLILLLIIFSMIMSFSIEEFSSIEETQNRKESRIIVTELTDLMMDVYIKGMVFLENMNYRQKLTKKHMFFKSMIREFL